MLTGLVWGFFLAICKVLPYWTVPESGRAQQGPQKGPWISWGSSLSSMLSEPSAYSCGIYCFSIWMQTFNEISWRRPIAANAHSGYLQRVRKPSLVTTAIPNCVIPDKPRQLSPPAKEPLRPHSSAEPALRPPGGPVPSPRPSAAISGRAAPPYRGNHPHGYRDGHKSRPSPQW